MNDQAALRRGTVQRTTAETDISVSIDLDGSGTADVSTGLPFFDHMLDQIGRHGGFDLTVSATGDLHVDGHHTVEDVGIAVGEAFREAVGDKAGVRRFASGLYPLDEALIEVALDLSGRPYVVVDLPFGEVLALGSPPFNPEMAEHFLVSFATSAAITLHVTKRGAPTPTTSSRPPSRAWPARCAMRYGWKVWASPPPRAPCDRRAPRIAVIDYGIGNLRSAEKALLHLGADAALVGDPEAIEAADAAVLPGVGAFGACMDALDASGLADVARSFAASGRPFLGICVGMQLLYEASDETPGRTGLGILEGTVGLIEGAVKRPQMQWNRLSVSSQNHPLIAGADGAWMYFVHSYAAPSGDEVIATCDYGGAVTAAVARGNVWAVQFHPEKSGDAGLALLENFVAYVGSGS